MFSKLVSLILKKKYAKVYHSILGLVIGSSVAIIPTIIIPEMINMSKNMSQTIYIISIISSVILFIIGILSTYYFSKIEENTKK